MATMVNTTTCPNCDMVMEIPPGLGVTRVECPRCETMFDLPTEVDWAVFSTDFLPPIRPALSPGPRMDHPSPLLRFQLGRSLRRIGSLLWP